MVNFKSDGCLNYVFVRWKYNYMHVFVKVMRKHADTMYMLAYTLSRKLVKGLPNYYRVRWTFAKLLPKLKGVLFIARNVVLYDAL